jgi:uroporphyrin-III C-methyltransferase / precorrin-2 dehydrogenase / sirohydrochlorin ferrochelatase
VTSAVAAPAAAGIPVTHRGLARQVAVVSGHDELDWSALAALDGTLVLLMAVSRLAETSQALVDAGRPASTPAAIVESAYSPRQRTTIGTLATIADLAHERDVKAPAVVVIGDVVTLHTALAPGNDHGTHAFGVNARGLRMGQTPNA